MWVPRPFAFVFIFDGSTLRLFYASSGLEDHYPRNDACAFYPCARAYVWAFFNLHSLSVCPSFGEHPKVPRPTPARESLPTAIFILTIRAGTTN